MGITAEYLARKYRVTREDQDEFAYASQMRAAEATRENHFQAEVLPKALTLMVLSEGMPWFPWGERLWPGGGHFPWSKGARLKTPR